MYLRILLSTILVGVLIFVLSRSLDLSTLESSLVAFPLTTLLSLLTISSAISILKAWRFLIILRNSSIQVSFWDNLKAFLASSAITPLPGGELARGVIVHKETGADMHQTTAPVITQAFFDLFSAAIVALIGSFSFHVLQIPVFIFFCLTSFLLFLMAHKTFLFWLTNKLPKGKIFNKFIKNAPKVHKQMRENVYDEESGLLDKVFVRAMCLSFIVHCLGGMLILLTAHALGVHLNIFQSIFLYAGSIVIGAIAITPGGIGITEGGITGLLLLFGVETSPAIAIVLVFRAMTLVFSVLTGLLFLFTFYSRVLIFKNDNQAK